MSGASRMCQSKVAQASNRPPNTTTITNSGSNISLRYLDDATVEIMTLLLSTSVRIQHVDKLGCSKTVAW